MKISLLEIKEIETELKNRISGNALEIHRFIGWLHTKRDDDKMIIKLKTKK